MRITAISVLVALMLAGIAFAGDEANEGKACKLEGVWTVGGPSDWFLSTITFQGTEDNHGTYVHEIINQLGSWLALPPGFGNPVGVQIPNARCTVRPGIWAKTGDKTYKTQAQGYVVANGDWYGIGLNVDAVALVFLDRLKITFKDCNTAEMEYETPYFLPGAQSPFTTLSSAPGDPGIMKRLLIKQEYPFQE